MNYPTQAEMIAAAQLAASILISRQLDTRRAEFFLALYTVWGYWQGQILNRQVIGSFACPDDDLCACQDLYYELCKLNDVAETKETIGSYESSILLQALIALIIRLLLKETEEQLDSSLRADDT